MSHLRQWQFEVAAEQESRFVAAYGPNGDWARLFATASGFIRTELWRNGDGIYLTADHWESFEQFERFQASHGEQYRLLDARLEGLALAETFLGAFDLVD
jgi:heme-degrading monooxygenase HmoA